MAHVYTWEYEVLTHATRYDEQMAFVTQALAAAECQLFPRPFEFTVQYGMSVRRVVMTHTLALALLDRFMDIDQGCYYLHHYPWLNQHDVGPTPLCPDP